MDNIKSKLIVWLFPFAYLLHLLDEFFLGAGFADWFSSLFNVSLSENDFLLINSIAFVVVVIIPVLYYQGKINNFILAVLGALFFINGIVHFMITIMTMMYSPGTITGLVVYIPLGILVYKKIFPLLKEEQRISSIVTAIVIHVLISVVAFII